MVSEEICLLGVLQPFLRVFFKNKLNYSFQYLFHTYFGVVFLVMLKFRLFPLSYCRMKEQLQVMNNQKTFAAYLTWKINAYICPQCSVELWCVAHPASGSQRALVFGRGNRRVFCEPVALKSSLTGANFNIKSFYLQSQNRQHPLKVQKMEQKIKKNLSSFEIRPKRALCVSMFRCLLSLVQDVITSFTLATGENLRLGKHASLCLPVLFGQ